ncbi:MAG: GNAT family N-acetyltransferase [Rickettsia endosymbiont of Bryobia graminum]|nr:GNAT family N-acetyltransferase [Rickettsia endosymbiont of Bryobia graminum]
MKAKFNIRLAKISDVPLLLPLIEQLGYPTFKEELEIRFERFVSNEDYGVAIACIDHKIIGFVAWSKSLLFISDKTRFHIEGLIVDKLFRGCGVGKELMNYIEKIADQYGPSIIDLTSGLRRSSDGTHEFYKKLNYHNDGCMAKLYLRKEI